MTSGSEPVRTLRARTDGAVIDAAIAASFPVQRHMAAGGGRTVPSPSWSSHLRDGVNRAGATRTISSKCAGSTSPPRHGTPRARSKWSTRSSAGASCVEPTIPISPSEPPTPSSDERAEPYGPGPAFVPLAAGAAVVGGASATVVGEAVVGGADVAGAVVAGAVVFVVDVVSGVLVVVVRSEFNTL